MTIKHLAIAILVAALSVPAGAQSGYDLFQKALAVERADGNLRDAIRLYERVVKESGRDRALIANAWIRLAECHQKLGDSEAQRIYERVVREFADQDGPADIARTRLVRSKGTEPQGPTSRLLWTLPSGGDMYGTVSPDGRSLPFTDWDHEGDLFVHDFSTGGDRRITNTAKASTASRSEFAEEAVFSRDGRQLAYAWFRGDVDRYELRLVDVRGTGILTPRVLFASPEVRWIGPGDWSADGKWIAVQLTRQDRTAQIGLISVEDGSLRVLRSSEWRGSPRLSFSGDGRYLAFSLPASDQEEQTDVFVLAADGTREVRAVAHPSTDVFVAWAPGGQRLLFASNRGGSFGLWNVRVADGRVQGEPELVTPNLGHAQNALLGLTTSGRLFSGAFDVATRSDIRVGTFDVSTGRFESAPTTTIQTFAGANMRPDWSPDGRSLAYVSRREAIGHHYFVVGIQSVATGAVREVTPSPGFSLLWDLRWAPDGRSLLGEGRDAKGRDGVFRIEVETGRTAPLVVRPANSEGRRSPAWSPDGKTLYYRRSVADARESIAFVALDVASGKERELIQQPNLGFVNLSPDGRYIATQGARSDRTASIRPDHPDIWRRGADGDERRR